MFDTASHCHHTAELHRLNALAELDILDTLPEQVFDQLTRLGALTLDMPYCAISLVDRERLWLKSAHGLTVTSLPREMSFCDEAIQSDVVMTIPDARLDVRFKDAPWVASEDGLRFYAGAPIAYKGYHIGAFCVADTRSHFDFGSRERAILQQLADAAAEIFDLRKDTGLGNQRQLYLD